MVYFLYDSLGKPTTGQPLRLSQSRRRQMLSQHLRLMLAADEVQIVDGIP